MASLAFFSLNNVPYFLWRSLKKRFCESVSLRDGSVLFHRRVALEWNVLRPEFFFALRGDKIISS